MDHKPLSYIEIKGARVNNLKGVSLSIPRNQFVVITGLSGSGKSSLAYDTIYAEGQRRYVESLSSYARQFLGRMHKPEVDFINGIPPAIAIEQKVTVRNPHSTVGTQTEIYDYLKLLFARVGITYSPVSGREVKKETVTDVVNFLISLPSDEAVLILYPMHRSLDKSFHAYLESLWKEGVTRVEINGEIERLDDLMAQPREFKDEDVCYVVADRVRISKQEDEVSRYADSVQTAFDEGSGECMIRREDHSLQTFSNRFECDGILFEEPNEYLFGFNSPYGACPRCDGFGTTIGIDENLVVPDKSLSVYENAIACWRGETMSAWKEKLIQTAEKFNFPIHKPYEQLSEQQHHDLWHGNRYFKGIDGFFAYVDERRYKIQYRVLKARFSGKTICPECKGGRLRKEASYVKIRGKCIQELVAMPVAQLWNWFVAFDDASYEGQIASRLLVEIKSRLSFLCNVGLGYLTLNRLSNTLSGGESQRIHLATSLGSSLVGSLYVLDEPSVGLHPRDTHLLINVLKSLRNMGNTVLVVEHDKDIIQAADQIVDVGPRAGRLGGEIVFSGSPDELANATNSITADYLTGKRKIEVPALRRSWRNRIKVVGASENNLKHIDVTFPLQVLTVVTGVSGSGKSTLVRNILYPAVSRYLDHFEESVGAFKRLEGDLQTLSDIQCVDQHPIGKSSRSNPVTYCKAYDEIRKLFAEQPLAKYNDFKPAHFTFNAEGGRCEVCQGEGTITVGMQFMADVKLVCEACKGKRFKEEILEVTYRSKNIYDVLDMTVDEAIQFFGEKKTGTEKKILERLKPLQDVGLGYIKLGQSSNTLSGGENQRVKLASFLGSKESVKPTLFIFDEPTTGLHLHDIQTLLKVLNALVERGHSVIVIEHNLEMIKSADWIIDMGPEAGEEGGIVVCEGAPEAVAKHPTSFTARYLREVL